MNNLAIIDEPDLIQITASKAVFSEHASKLTDIYQDDVNLIVWQNNTPKQLTQIAQALINQRPHLKAVLTVTPDNCFTQLTEYLDDLEDSHELCKHISLLVDMFCTLFELKGAGLRLTALDKPMCPKFHVDKVPCRLITTFVGSATQWLSNGVIDRTKLGKGSTGKTDAESGLYQYSKDIQQLDAGDIALVKGEGWINNEGGGLVHRSPELAADESRLLLTLDFID